MDHNALPSILGHLRTKTVEGKNLKHTLMTCISAERKNLQEKPSTSSQKTNKKPQGKCF